MAVTADQVQVSLQANVDNYIANLRRADKAFDSVVANMEADAKRVGAAFSSLRGPEFDFNPAKIDEAAGSMNRLGGSTANVAAQFQDIAVQLQAGQSPLTIALQQGTQLSAVFEQLRANGQRVGPALVGAFTSIISPISLATIAVIALAGAAVQLASTLGSSMETANDAIARHREALEGIVDGYESAEGAVADYLDAADQLSRGVAIYQVQQQFAEIRKEGEKFRVEAEQIGGMFVTFGKRAELDLGAAARAFASGTMSAEEFYLELRRIRDTDLNFLDYGLREIIGRMEEGALKAIAFGNAINQLVNASHALAGIGQDEALATFFDENKVESVIEKLKGLTPELRTQQEIINQTYSEALANPALTDAAREQLAAARDTALAAQAEAEARNAAKEAATEAASAARKSAGEVQREREAVQSLLEKLREEAALVGIVGAEKEVLVALRQAGAAATAAEREEIETLVRFTYEEAQAIKENQKSLQEFLSIGESGVNTFIDAILDGKSATEAWGSALQDIGRQLIRLGVNSLFSSEGPIAGLFSFGGPKAAGGPVSGGRTYLVGEKGPELFTPSSAGNITPNHQLTGGASVTFAPVIDNRGADVAAVARLETTMARWQAEFIPRVRREVAGRNRKW